jgi:hypothetical protein
VVFARAIGRLEWICPSCNILHITAIKPHHKALWCEDCNTLWYLGTVFYKAPMGPKPLPPRDTLMIGGGFPLKREVNRIYCSNCTEEILPQVLEKMAHHDVTPIVHSGKKPSKPSEVSKPQAPGGEPDYAGDDELTG